MPEELVLELELEMETEAEGAGEVYGEQIDGEAVVCISIVAACAGASRFCDQHLVLPKLLYFSLNILCYSTYTFTANYFKDVWGIPSHHFGYIIGLCAVSFTGSILWTIIADRTRQYKFILSLSALGYAVSFLALRTNLFVHADITYRFVFVATFYGFSNFFTSALYPLLDNRVFFMLSKDPRFSKELFGRQRLFGTIGQSLITAINGFAIRSFGYDAIFVSLVLSATLFLSLIFVGIPSDTAVPSKDDPKAQAEGVDGGDGGGAHCSGEGKDGDGEDGGCKIEERALIAGPEEGYFWKPAMMLLSTPDFAFFLLVILIAGTTRGVVGNYLPQYLHDSMHLSPEMVGILLQTRIITEIAIFFLGKQMLLWMGVYWMLFLAQLTGFLRVLVYALLPTHYPWTMVPLVAELLKGINSACLISAGARYVYDYAPIGTEATAQGFFSGVHSYLANSASGFFGGLILELHNNDPAAFQFLFKYTAVLALLGIVLFTLRYMIAVSSTSRCT